jgi:Salmonella virulence plasmid 65kDa B protein/FG-GAP-like repeat/Insecticide toxin TcdB middle/N-terminal region
MPAQQRGRVIGASLVLHVLGRGALSLALALLSWSSAAQVSVSSSGSPNYSQPVAVPPGISGMQPNLALHYAGGGVNGPVGHGWSVQGLSMITRCPASRYTDGAPRGVKFDANDKLCLDGQRLIQTDANGVVTPAFPQTNDALGLATGYREYRTEKDSYARIRAYGVANTNAVNGPAYFKVWTKAGQVYEYGATLTADANTKAAVAAQGKNVIMVWAVARISDVTNNYIDFKYDVRDVAWGSGPTVGSPTLGREWNIVEIQYTGNSAVPQVPTNKVIFRYSDRTLDKSEAYQQGSKNVSVRRLDAIDIYVNSPNSTVLLQATGATLVKRTKLTYDTSGVTKRSRLASVKECTDAAETKCLPPTTFSYSAGGNDGLTANANFNLATANLKNNNGYGVLTGDFDGDGKTDVMRWSNDRTVNTLYFSNGDGTFRSYEPRTGQTWSVHSTNLFWQPSSGARIDSCYMSVVVDLNGDGLADILRWANPSTTGLGGTACTAGQQSIALLSSGSGPFQSVVLTEETSGVPLTLPRTQVQCSGLNNCTGKNFYLGDFNGDGYIDIAEVSITGWDGNNGGYTCSLSGGTLGTTCYLRVRWGRGNGQFSAPVFSGAPVFSDPSRSDIFVMDADGDGLSDLVLRGFTGVNGVALLSNGDGQFTRVGGLPGCTTHESNPQFADVNGDGRADFICAQTPVTSNRIFLATAGTSSFANGPSTAAGVTSLNRAGDDLVSSAAMPGATFVASDFNGDGRSDVLRFADDPLKNLLYLSNGDGTFTGSLTFFVTGTVQFTKSDGTADIVLGDFLGNGTTQILRLWRDAPTGTTPATRNLLYVKSDPTPPDQLVSVTGPTGLRTTLTYGSLADAASGRYTNDRSDATNKAMYPLVDLTIASPVVNTTTSDVGVGTNTLQTQYAYKGLKAALDGRGMLGFRQTVQQNTAANGEALSVWTDYLLGEPYAGVARLSQTRRGAWNAPTAQLLSTTTNTYCDRTSATNPDLATDVAPCATTAKVRRPYLRKTVESGNDLDGTVLPTVTTTNTYNDYGDPTNIVVTTTGTVAGVANQTTTKATANTLCAPDSAGCPNRTAGDNWILGRLTRSTVTNTVPNLIDSIAISPGNAPNATAIVGTLAGAAQPALALANCTSTSPTTAPTAATMSCTLSNSGQAGATSISYTTATSTTVSGPTGACAAGATCGTVTVTTATTAAIYSGTLTTTPNAGTAASQAINLVVNAAASGGWTFCSIEGNTCALPAAGNYSILYAPDSASAQSITLSFSNVSSVACNSTTFGGDPAVGVVKQCFYKVVSTSPALSLNSCTTTSPTTAPTAATMSCTLSNTGQAATSSISYATAASTTVTGPTGACAAGATCGTVTVTTGATAATYSGTLTATPNAGTAASQAINLVVNAAATGWTFCAIENNVCNLPAVGNYQVLYGPDSASAQSVTLNFSNVSSVACNNTTFGGDPAFGVVKQCFYKMVSTSPALSLGTCTTTSPTTAPTAATLSCPLSNTGQAAASSISYTTAANTTVSGPTGACAAGVTCGTVTVTTGTTAATYSGTLTVTPNTGTAATQAISLVVNAATPPGSARDFTLASNAGPMAPPYVVAVGQLVTVVPAASGAEYSVVYWGDGTYSTIPGGWNSATPISQMTRSYSATGTYTIEYATQIGGTWDSRTVTLTVVSQ